MSAPVVPGNRALTSEQQQGLDWVARIGGGRDVVLAIDLTESVGINDPGRQHLRQIIEKTLNPGDTVHIISFATTTRPPIVFQYQGENSISEILAAIPMNAGSEQGTDIMCAELDVYKYVAQLNQDRLVANQPIKPQSVIWITDAPLEIPEGQSQQWIEAPNSSCGLAGSELAQARTVWMKDLPRTSREIQPGQFRLTVVDIEPTVQEFCTPRPGGGEVCLVNDYLVKQLWLPSLLGIVLLVGVIGFAAWGLHRNRRWQINITLGEQDFPFQLGPGQKVGLGAFGPGCVGYIPLQTMELQGTLERNGTNLYITQQNNAFLTLNGQAIIGTKEIPRNLGFFTFECTGQTIQVTVNR